MGLEVLLIPFIIVGIAFVGGSKAESKSSRDMQKRGEFCTVYTTKDGGNNIRECYQIRNTR